MRSWALVAAAKITAAVGVYSLLLISGASAELSCKSSLEPARKVLAADITALRKVEHEASDRLKGLDTRPFPVLRDEARKLAARIGPELMLKLEESLKRCRNRTYPIHTVCAGAATALGDLIDKHVATPKPDYDKAAFAESMKECERMMDLQPLKSSLRGAE